MRAGARYIPPTLMNGNGTMRHNAVLDGEIIARRLDDSRLYDGVRTRRICAFLIDYLIVCCC